MSEWLGLAQPRTGLAPRTSRFGALSTVSHRRPAALARARVALEDLHGSSNALFEPAHAGSKSSTDMFGTHRSIGTPCSAVTVSDMFQSSDMPAVGELRALSRKTRKRVKKLHDRPIRRVLRWVRRHRHADDAAIQRHVDWELRLQRLESAFRANGLPSPASLDQPYTAYGRRWHRRELAKALDEAGITPTNLDRIAVITPTARWDQYTEVVTLAHKLARFAEPYAAKSDEDATTVAKLVRSMLSVPPGKHRTHYAWLRRLSDVDALVWDLLVPVADQPGFEHLSLLERAQLAMSGLVDKAGADPSWVVAAAVMLPYGATPAQAHRSAQSLNGDVVKARILAGTKLSAAKLEELGTHKALAESGTGDLVAYTHLHQSRLGRYAHDVAYAFSVQGLPDPRVRDLVRRLSVRALSDLLDDLDAPSREEIVAAVRIVSVFSRRTSDYLRAVSTAARRHGRAVPSVVKLGAWLPSDLDGSQFVPWLLAHGRAQSVLQRNGRAALASIAANFSELRDDERGLSVRDTAAKLRLRGYGAVGETAFGSVCAEIGVSPTQANAVAPRWTNALSVPQLFPPAVCFPDEPTGLVGRFLPRDDPRGLWLGLLTDCCQYPGSIGEPCAWVGHEHPLHGFFVVEDAHRRVVAQSWVWSDGNGGACFDSIERKNRRVSLSASSSKGDRRRARAIRRIYRSAGEHLLGWFSVVNVGPAWGLGKLTRQPTEELMPVAYNGYRDSHTQHLLASRDETEAGSELTVRSARSGYKLQRKGTTLATVTSNGVTVARGHKPGEVRDLFVAFGHDEERLVLTQNP